MRRMKAALKKVEGSAADRKMDRKLKEGSPADMRADKKLARKMMKK